MSWRLGRLWLPACLYTGLICDKSQRSERRSGRLISKIMFLFACVPDLSAGSGHGHFGRPDRFSTTPWSPDGFNLVPEPSKPQIPLQIAAEIMKLCFSIHVGQRCTTCLPNRLQGGPRAPEQALQPTKVLPKASTWTHYLSSLALASNYESKRPSRQAQYLSRLLLAFNVKLKTILHTPQNIMFIWTMCRKPLKVGANNTTFRLMFFDNLHRARRCKPHCSTPLDLIHLGTVTLFLFRSTSLYYVSLGTGNHIS